MSVRRFLALFFGLNLCFLFIKIYQHNTVVGLSYTCERLATQTALLKQTYNDKRVRLFQYAAATAVCSRARQELGLKPMALAQIRDEKAMVQQCL